MLPDNIKISRIFLFLLILCNLILVLDGCGFRLRGSLGSNVELPPVFLEGAPGSAVMVELKQTLQAIGTEIVTDRSQAQYVVNIISERQNRRILSVSSAGAVQEYELQYTLTFGVTDPQGKVLLESQNISNTRSFSYAETDVLAKGSEEKSLVENMRQDAVQGLIRRLQALKPVAADQDN